MPVSTNNHHLHTHTHYTLPPSVYLAAAGGITSSNNNSNDNNNNAKVYVKLPPSSASSSSFSSENSANISPITASSSSAQMQCQHHQQQHASSSSSSSSSSVTSGLNENTKTITKTKTNTNNLTSMQKFWMNHIVINERIIPLSKLQPTVGVQPWKETGTPKKFNKWCLYFLKEGKCRFGDKCFNAHPKPKSTPASIEAESQHISVLEGKKPNTGSAHQQQQQQQQQKKNDKNENIVVDRFAVLGNTRASSSTTTTKTTAEVKSTSLLNDDELVPIWCQRDRIKVYYPLSKLNAESMKRHKANKTVSDCYFQSKCKDPTCTFLHMDECYVKKNLTIYSK